MKKFHAKWPVWRALLWREALEYRDWWTVILITCICSGSAFVLLAHIWYGAPNPQVSVEQTFLLVRWCQGFLMAGCGLMAMAHAAHGIFDERQDRSIGFWQSWPVSEMTRLTVKSIAITWGWALLSCVGALSIFMFAGVMQSIMGNGGLFFEQSAPYLEHLVFSTLRMGGWAWPLVCVWLWCSAVAPKSPWLWCWMMGAICASVAFLFNLPFLPLGLGIALGPSYGALVEALGLGSNWLPWQTGSVAWWCLCLIGWAGVKHAAHRLITHPEI